MVDQAGSELYQVSAGRLLESGTLAIGNGGTGEVLYIDAAGEVVRRAGGEGDGPGEFRAITSFLDARGDTLTVYDVRLGRLTTLDPDGAVVEIRTLEPPSRVVDLVPLTLGDDGRVLAIHGDARIFARSGVRRDTAPLMLIHPSSAVDTLGWWPAKEWSFGSTARASFRTEVGFGRSLEASGRHGRAVVGSTDTLVLVVVDLDGEEVMRIEGTGPNRPVSDEQVERWRADRLANLPDDVPATIRTAIRTAPPQRDLPGLLRRPAGPGRADLDRGDAGSWGPRSAVDGARAGRDALVSRRPPGLGHAAGCRRRPARGPRPDGARGGDRTRADPRRVHLNPREAMSAHGAHVKWSARIWPGSVVERRLEADGLADRAASRRNDV